jgi:hypothetical protein
MATASRIYIVAVIDPAGKPEQRLVRAVNSAQAWRHIADSRITVDLATQDELVELASAGVKVEEAITTAAPSAVLALVMGPDDDLAKPIMEPAVLTVCETCSTGCELPIAALPECVR